MSRNIGKAAAVLAVAALTTMAGPLPAQSQDIVATPETIAVRIDLAGRQRMLLERMAKNFCNARSGVDIGRTVGVLTKAIDLFERTHTGFRKGDVEQRLFPAERAGPKKAWEQVNRMWLPLKHTYGQALAGEFVSEEDFAGAMAQTLEARKRANDMVVQLRASYTSDMGDGGFGSTLLLDLYGRQRMLSQKLSKEVCLMARGYQPDTMPAELAATLDLFETSLGAFIQGMPIAGVPKPPTAEIADQLSVADAEWQKVRPTALLVASGGAASLSDLAEFAAGTDRFLVEMNKAVKMLAAHQAASS